MADYTRCRTLGHAWYDFPAEWRTEFGTPVTLRCERCGTERREAIDNSDGHLIARHYVYPDGYRYAPHQTPSRAEFRLALLSLRLKEARARRRLRAVD